MTSLTITPSHIPPLTGKTALVTGGSSEITLSTALLLAEKGCSKVVILDPEHNEGLMTAESETETESDSKIPACMSFLKVDVRKWEELKPAVEGIEEGVDYAFYVPGPERILFEVGGEGDDDREEGVGMDWAREVRTVGGFVRVCWGVMARFSVEGSGEGKGRGKGGSVVVCVPGGVGGYMACHVLPPGGMPGEGVMDGCAGAAILGMIRSLRTVMMQDGVTINGVALGPTFPSSSGLIPPATPLPPLTPAVRFEQLPVQTADEIALALVFSATAKQKRKVEVYGKEKDSDLFATREEDKKWNGRVILTAGTSPMKYTEVEEGLTDLRGWWLGRDNVRMVRMQQAMGDFRPFEVEHKWEFQV